MVQQPSLQPLGRAVSTPPDSLLRLVTAALVRLVTAALALVVAMLVVSSLASSRPLSWTAFLPTATEFTHSQLSSEGVDTRLFDANANNDGYVEGLAKAVD